MEHGILESKLRIYVLKLMNSDIERFIFSMDKVFPFEVWPTAH